MPVTIDDVIARMVQEARNRHQPTSEGMTEEEERLQIVLGMLAVCNENGYSREKYLWVFVSRFQGKMYVKRICADPKSRAYLQLDAPAPVPDKRQTVVGRAPANVGEPVDPYLQTR